MATPTTNGSRGSHRARQAEPLTAADFENAFPASRRVYVEGPNGVRVPMREITLSGGEAPLRVYDTRGPLVVDPRRGLPRIRESWVQGRGVEGNGKGNTLFHTEANGGLHGGHGDGSGGNGNG